jgi:4-amino-4-deoxy-L-arabinose transferase-like glycosyltransferase
VINSGVYSMSAKITFFIGRLQQNRKWIFFLMVLLILARFSFLIIYNWNNGNTGKPGVQYLTDSYRYIEAAGKLIANEALDYKEIQYTGYIVIIAFFRFFSDNLVGVVLLQVIMALAAAWALYKISFAITTKPLAGIIAAGLYLMNPFIVSWHNYIMTESMYTSLLILSTWMLIRAVEKRSDITLVFSILLVLITACIRPNGWTLIPIALCFYVMHRFHKNYQKVIWFFSVAMGFVICVSFLPFTNRSVQNIGTEKILMNEVLLNGEVIPDHKELRIKMPADTALMKKNWTAGFSYVIRHPLTCAKLGIYRIATELFQIRRPWYSAKYYLRSFLWIFPAYIFAMIGLIYYRKKTGIKIILAIILVHILTIAVTFADHDARFLNYFLPLINILSGCGITFVIDKMALSGRLPVKPEPNLK